MGSRRLAVLLMLSVTLGACGGASKPDAQATKLREYKEIFRRDQARGHAITEEALEHAGLTGEQAEEAWDSAGTLWPGKTGSSPSELEAEAEKEREEATAALTEREKRQGEEKAQGALEEKRQEEGGG